MTSLGKQITSTHNTGRTVPQCLKVTTVIWPFSRGADKEEQDLSGASSLWLTANMVLPALIDTPRTEAGNATFTSNSGLDFSIEQSFVSTSKENQDVLQRLQSKHKDTQLKTPSVRYPLLDRRNAPTGTSNGEFTPLLKSVAKSNLLRRHSKENGVPRTPAVLKSGYRSVDPSPALPAESSALWAGDTGSSFALGNSDETPMPNIASNSTTSTPLAKLPKSDDAAIVDDGKNVMTLREQENVRHNKI